MLLKPVTVIGHGNIPGVRFRNRKVPELSVVTARTAPVSWSVAVTAALGTTALLGSRTVPTSELETVWPNRQLLRNNSAQIDCARRRSNMAYIPLENAIQLPTLRCTRY